MAILDNDVFFHIALMLSIITDYVNNKTYMNSNNQCITKSTQIYIPTYAKSQNETLKILYVWYIFDLDYPMLSKDMITDNRLFIKTFHYRNSYHELSNCALITTYRFWTYSLILILSEQVYRLCYNNTGWLTARASTVCVVAG